MTCSLCYARYVLCHRHQNSRAETYPDPRWDHMYSTYLEDWLMRKEEIKKAKWRWSFLSVVFWVFFLLPVSHKGMKVIVESFFVLVSSEVNDRKLDSWVDRDISFECFHVMTSINREMTRTNTYRGTEYCADGTVRSPWLKEVKRAKDSEKRCQKHET